MAAENPFGPLMVALWIPTDGDGAVRTRQIREHLAWLRREGVTGVLALGSTGEFPHFEEKQRLELLQSVVEAAAPLPVLANVSAVSPASARRVAAAAKGIGCAAIIMLPPWYFSVGEDDLLEFFLRVSEASDLPAWIYNFPERTGNRVSPRLVERFAALRGLAGVKHSGAEWDLCKDFVALGRTYGFPVYTGAEPRALEAAQAGCAGLISGMANFIPRALSRVLGADAAAAATALQEVRLAAGIIGALPFPIDVSAGMAAAGWDPGAFKSAVSAPTRALYDTTIARLKPLLGGRSGS